MPCADHPDCPSTADCSLCRQAVCAACTQRGLDGSVQCASCRRADDARRSELGSGMLLGVGAAYLATLAILVSIFHGRPFVGAAASLVALALGRALVDGVRSPRLADRAGEREDR